MVPIRQDFVLSQCTVNDVEEMINVYSNAFEDDYFGSFAFPKTIPQDAKRKWLTERFTKMLSKPEIRTFKITEVSTGKMAAWARWTFPYVFSEKEKIEKEREKQEREKEKAKGLYTEWPPGANLEICGAKFGALERLKNKYVDPENMYMVSLLCTDPAFQRKGLASMLLTHGTDLADAEGRKTYIEATAMGHPVYLKLGFKDVDNVTMDLSKWGGKELGVNRTMLRDPQPPS